MKHTNIQIRHAGETPDPAAITRAFNWITNQISAVDLERARHVNVSIDLEPGVSVDFNLSTIVETPEEPTEAE